MMTMFHRLRTTTVLVTLLIARTCLSSSIPSAGAAPLPRFTEEREAAALHFVRKHCPELLPLLEELKRTNRPLYERQILETFQVTELLADLLDDPKRYEVELRIWKTENQAMVLVAQLTTAKPEERESLDQRLQHLARELIELEAQAIECRIELLQAELAFHKEELAKHRDQIDRLARERYEALLEKARKKKP
jgi:hypothetical protein